MAMSNHNHDGVQINIELEQLTAYALGQLEGEELAAMKAKLAAGDEAAEQEITAVQALCAVVSDVRAAEPTPALASDLRYRIQEKLADAKAKQPAAEPVTIAASKKSWWRRSTFELCLIGGICCALLVLFLLPAAQSSREAARRMQSSNHLKQLGLGLQNHHDAYARVPEGAASLTWEGAVDQTGSVNNLSRFDSVADEQR